MKNLEENNKLIAEFMDARYEENKSFHESSDAYYEDCELEYHTSWDWLMPVVSKIFDLANDMLIRDVLLEQKNNAITMYDDKLLIETDIDKVYKSVVEFIKWYNENK